MQTENRTRSILTLTIEGRRRRAQIAVDEFHADLAKYGINYAVSWDAVPAMVAEMVLDALARFDKAVEEHGADRAVEMSRDVREDRIRRIGYFDPTNTSTSGGASLAAAAEFQGHRAVVEILDEIEEAHKVDNEG